MTPLDSEAVAPEISVGIAAGEAGTSCLAADTHFCRDLPWPRIATTGHHRRAR